MATTRPQSGFTLIEVLLAIGITATVMVTVGSTFHVLLNARDVVDDLTESTEAGPRILNLIERDLRGIWTYNIHNNAVFRGRNMDVNGRDADRMDFLTTTDASGFVLDQQDVPRKPSICEVGYWFKPNPRYRDVFEMWRREDPMVDQELTTQGSFQLVHDRVKSFKVTYYETLGYEAEERLEWDSTVEDKLPKRIKIEFTIERRRSNRNVVNDLEIEDFEGAEKSYVRHIVFDHRLDNILQAGTARVPVLPPEPTAEGGGGQGPGPAGGGGGGGGGDRKAKQTTGSGEQPFMVGSKPPPGRNPSQMTTTQGRRPGATPSPGTMPPGFDLGRFLSGLGRGGSGGGGGGAGGLFGGR